MEAANVPVLEVQQVLVDSIVVVVEAFLACLLLWLNTGSGLDVEVTVFLTVMFSDGYSSNTCHGIVFTGQSQEEKEA